MKISLPNTAGGLSAILVLGVMKLVMWLGIWYVAGHFVVKYW